ncbi:hypothetical protein BCR35DRAFT_307056 [Leucosporidium creatinivorum]|uniref:DUF6534 domain-containing protein n=1 Tax=Leucosporidium creatinivorum TaxID=106004 RepID=A0A1Y2EPX9_9BASI|nr:hypothetical protein BCR35DRAFT_307056 [Leucosporidium creatinivorum]
MSDVESNLGALLIGLIIAVYLTSTSNGQVVTYMKTTYDHQSIQLIVIFAALASTAHTGILCYALYDFLISNFGNQDFAGTAEWSFVGHFAIFTFIALIVQLYYAHKITSFCSGKRRIALVGGIVVLALAQTAFGILSAWSTYRLPLTDDIFQVELRSALGWQMLASLIAAVLCDLLICGAMVREHRTPRYTVRSEGMLEVLTRLFIETNLITAIVAILSLAFYVAFHAKGVSTAFAICTPKLYLMGMLASINRRDVSRAGISSTSYHSNPKHESSLSDMFKGTPMTKLRGEVSTSRIGMPTPINDMFTNKDPNSPGWLRRTFSHEPESTPFTNTQRAPAPGETVQWHSNLHPSHAVGSKTSHQGSGDALSISDYGAWTGHAYSSSVELSQQSPRGKNVSFAQEQREYSSARFSVTSKELEAELEKELRERERFGVGQGGAHRVQYPFI